MVLTGYAGPGRAHLAVVASQVSDREIPVDHANWLERRLAIYRDDPVVDVSSDNDWSEVRIYNPRAHAWGIRTYIVQGFIGPRSWTLDTHGASRRIDVTALTEFLKPNSRTFVGPKEQAKTERVIAAPFGQTRDQDGRRWIAGFAHCRSLARLPMVRAFAPNRSEVRGPEESERATARPNPAPSVSEPQRKTTDILEDSGMALNDEATSFGHGAQHTVPGRTATLALGALGVVYGDIGTSPLYALRESVSALEGNKQGVYEASAAVSHFAALAAASMIFWSLIFVVTIKYVIFIMRADNDGEGGVLALAALAHRSARLSRRLKMWIGIGAVIGLALFIGDGMLTPAISVLSAVEYLGDESQSIAPLVVPLTLIILIGLFAFENKGTATIGRLFGPIMAVWFAVLAALGIHAIIETPQVLMALSPTYAVQAFIRAPAVAFTAMGAVVLAVTGCEALYADMGHFGKQPIRLAWLYVVLPSLVLVYFGQAAAILRDPHATATVFYAFAPRWAHYPLLLLAVVATVIASQAVISGVYSITRQAVQLGQLPRMEIRHTSAIDVGQIYVPRANAYLCVGVVLIVLIFKSSSALAAAYGIAVTGVMVISTMLVSIVAYRQWGWNRWMTILVFGGLALIDLSFLAANSLKIVDGGWLPLFIAAVIFVLMDIWRKGRRAHLEKVRSRSLPLDLFLERADKTPRASPARPSF